MKYFSIIIPTLNESENILPLLENISRVCRPLAMQPEVIFVDDDSTDGTRQIIADYSGELEVRLIHRTGRRGLAGAVVEGAGEAANEWVVVMDADLSHPPEVIPSLLEPLELGSHDMVIGSRYVEGGETPAWPLMRRISSRLASIPARLLTSVQDPLPGFFAVGRKRLSVLDSDLPGFKICLEILARAKSDFRVHELPISFTDRRAGASKMNSTVLRKYLRQVWGLWKNQPIVPFLRLFMVTGLVAGLFDYIFFCFFTGLGYPLETSHLASLLLSVHLCYPVTRRFFYRKNADYASGDYLRFLTIVLMGLFLRGGLLAFPSLSLTTASALTPFLLIATGGVIWMAAMLIVHSGILMVTEGRRWKFFCALFIGYALLLHLVYLGRTELIQEEAYYWNYSQHMATGYLDHPPVIALLIRLGTLLCGDNEFGVRLGAFFSWFVTAFFVYRLAKMRYSGDTGLRAVLLVAILPVFFGTALVSTPDAPLISCWAGALYFLYRALVQLDKNSWYGAGICLGLGLASKYTIAFLGPAILLFMLVDPDARKWFSRPQPYLAALFAFTLFSPVIWWNYQHDWASFLFQSQRRLQASFDFSTHKLLASMLILLTPVGFFAAIAALLPRAARDQDESKTGRQKALRAYLFCLLMTLIPLSIFVLFSFTKAVKLNWTGPLWLACLPFMAYSMVHVDGGLQRRLRTLWPKAMVVLVLSYGLFLHYCALGLPGVSYAKSDFLFGWETLAQQVEEKVRAVAVSGGERPLVVGMDSYRTASGLAFYRQKLLLAQQGNYPAAETTGRHLFGIDDLMFRYWYPPAQAAGRDLMVVSRDKGMLAANYFSSYYKDLGPIQEISLDKRGKKVGSYYYRMLNRYCPERQEALTISQCTAAEQQRKHLATVGNGG